LNGSGGNHFGRLVKACVDHLESSVAQRACDHFRPTVMSVEARLCYKNSNFSLAHALHLPTPIVGVKKSVLGRPGFSTVLLESRRGRDCN
jgi:hypothetical protein